MVTVLKYILISLILFSSGVAVGIYFEEELRILIRSLYGLITNQRIYFYGNHLNFNASDPYYLAFGIYFSMHYILTPNLGFRRSVKYIILALSSFLVTLTILCAIDSHAKLIECTSCVNGTRGLQYGEVNYETMVLISLAVSLVASALPMVLRWRPFKRARA